MYSPHTDPMLNLSAEYEDSKAQVENYRLQLMKWKSEKESLDQEFLVLGTKFMHFKDDFQQSLRMCSELLDINYDKVTDPNYLRQKAEEKQRKMQRKMMGSVKMKLGAVRTVTHQAVSSQSAAEPAKKVPQVRLDLNLKPSLKVATQKLTRVQTLMK